MGGLHSWDAWCAHWSHMHAATLRGCGPWIARSFENFKCDYCGRNVPAHLPVRACSCSSRIVREGPLLRHL